jgi:hypothetical protein
MRKAISATDHIAVMQASAPLMVDEKVWAARESDHVVGGKRRRIQRVFVRRGDTELEFQLDRGPAELFKHEYPWQFFAGNEYSMGEVQEIAMFLREAKPEAEEPHNLMQDWFKQLDRQRSERTHRSNYGYGGWVQRD